MLMNPPTLPYQNLAQRPAFDVSVAEYQIRSANSTYIGNIYVMFSPCPMFDNLLETSPREDSNKLFKIGCG